MILASIGGFIMAMRNQMITTMDEDFVLVARGQGPSHAACCLVRGAQRAAAGGANFAIALSLIVSGQILVEIVFNYPGIGFHLYDALGKLDYSLVQGIFVVITLVVLAANLVADVVYVLIDPRARQRPGVTINSTSWPRASRRAIRARSWPSTGRGSFACRARPRCSPA